LFPQAINPTDTSYGWKEEFLRLRVRMLEAQFAFTNAVNGLMTCPPPSTWRGSRNGTGSGGASACQSPASSESDKTFSKKGGGGDGGVEDAEELYKYGAAAHEVRTTVLTLFFLPCPSFLPFVVHAVVLRVFLKQLRRQSCCKYNAALEL
jgi:hypothetical protein